MSVSEKIKKNIGRGFLTASFFLFVFAPISTAFGQTTITGKMCGITFMCTNGGDPCPASGDPAPGVPCEGFDLLIQAVQGIAKFAVGLGLAFSVVVIAYAGGIYLTSGGEPAARKKANDMFVKVAWGIFWILAAWLIINLIMNALTSGTGVKQLLQ